MLIDNLFRQSVELKVVDILLVLGRPWETIVQDDLLVGVLR